MLTGSARVRAPPTHVPLTAPPQVMPHCFDPAGGEESVVMLGAPHGATAWTRIHAADDSGELHDARHDLCSPLTKPASDSYLRPGPLASETVPSETQCHTSAV